MGHVTPDPFQRADETTDTAFYVQPRLVNHIDDGAIAALRGFYGELLAPNSVVLDLMSAWRSHLPPAHGRSAHPYREVVGLGMNTVEMDENPQLDTHVVHDLNASPFLPFEDAAFDAAICNVSVQYLVRPIEVFGELRRVVTAGGPVAVSFSNRCFPTKAVAIWMAGGRDHHVELVSAYFDRGGFGTPSAHDLDSTDDPITVVWAPSPGPGAPPATDAP